MRWCLLLIWAQGLRQALLPASGAMTGRIVTVGNISAEEGGSVTLQCHLSSTTAKVTQVNWKQQDQVLAIRHDTLGWHIDPPFMKRVVPGPNLGLTLRSLTVNDTGEYFCIYHTYPDGIYTGTLFLEVLRSSAAEHRAGFQITLFGAVATVLAVVCTAVMVMVTWARKKSLRTCPAEGALRQIPSEREECRPRVQRIPASIGVPVEAVAGDLYAELRGQDPDAEQHDYFNVLSYRSLGSFSFPTETG
ncbi:T-cell immunoreceptor with Ig and ITIM domains isoform X2 [Sus scrofa]|nr:T-cell immunoreceptor with Ig and ITIM domains isoform X2 [Sus scrofa]XP_020926008.1 T-cell immunoreceptor with Ig and ITIM domains isoform X2 [Sus scrofa]